jgi:glutamyl/glutaminyl-tRNA synthetase
LSKRTGATSAEEYRDMGILPSALFNFLLLLGWAPGHDQEIIARDEAASMFDLSDVNKAPAVFDQEKLLWMNGQYMMHSTADELYPHLLPFIGDQAAPLDDLRGVLELNKARARTLKDLAAVIAPYLAADDGVRYEDEAVKKYLKGDDLAARMSELHDALSRTEPFDVNTTEQALRKLAESRGQTAGKYIHPLRVALLGVAASPPIFDVVITLGKERSLRRLRNLIDHLPKLAA